MTDRLDELFRPHELRDAVVDELKKILVVNRGELSREQARVAADLAGMSERHVYRLAAGLKDDLEFPPEPVETFFERIDRLGPRGFVMDDTFWALYYAFDGNMCLLRERIVELGFSMPSEPTLCRMIHRDFPEIERVGARKGLRDRFKHLIVLRQPDGTVMEYWEVDEFIWDFHVRHPERKQTIKPHGLLIVDRASRAVLSSLFLPRAVRSVDYQMALAAAYELCGQACGTLVFDNAPTFTSQVVEDALGAFTPKTKPCKAFTPTGKGRVERAGKTIQAKLISGLAGRNTVAQNIDGSELTGGSLQEALSWDAAARLASEAVDEYNTEVWDHFGCSRLEYLLERLPEPLRWPDEVLARLYQPAERDNGMRTLQPDGVLSKPLGGAAGSSAYWNGSCRRLLDTGSRVQLRLARGSNRGALTHEDTFVGWVYHQDHMPKAEETAIKQMNAEATGKVLAHAAAARQVSAANNANIDAGGKRTPVGVVVTMPDLAKVREEPKPRPGKRPATRRTGDTQNVTGAPSGRRGSSLAARQAAMGVDLHPEPGGEGDET